MYKNNHKREEVEVRDRKEFRRLDARTSLPKSIENILSRTARFRCRYQTRGPRRHVAQHEALQHVATSRGLLSSFLSSSNSRTDKYRGSLTNCMLLFLEAARLVLDAMGSGMPVFFRVSATHWLGQSRPDEAGWKPSRHRDSPKP